MDPSARRNSTSSPLGEIHRMLRPTYGPPRKMIQPRRDRDLNKSLRRNSTSGPSPPSNPSRADSLEEPTDVWPSQDDDSAEKRAFSPEQNFTLEPSPWDTDSVANRAPMVSSSERNFTLEPSPWDTDSSPNQESDDSSSSDSSSDNFTLEPSPWETDSAPNQVSMSSSPKENLERDASSLETPLREDASGETSPEETLLLESLWETDSSPKPASMAPSSASSSSSIDNLAPELSSLVYPPDEDAPEEIVEEEIVDIESLWETDSAPHSAPTAAALQQNLTPKPSPSIFSPSEDSSEERTQVWATPGTAAKADSSEGKTQVWTSQKSESTPAKLSTEANLTSELTAPPTQSDSDSSETTHSGLAYPRRCRQG